MNGELIFYLANKTGACEAALRREMKRIGVEITSVMGATRENELKYALKQAVNHSNLIFVLGGREAPEGRDAVSVLDQALSSSGLKWDEGPGWLVLQSGRQTIVSLPDDPEALSRMLEERLLYTLSSRYSLRMGSREKGPEVQAWSLPLDERPGPEAERQTGEIESLPDLSLYETQKKRLPAWVLAAAGAGVLVLAVLCLLFFW